MTILNLQRSNWHESEPSAQCTIRIDHSKTSNPLYAWESDVVMLYILCISAYHGLRKPKKLRWMELTRLTRAQDTWRVALPRVSSPLLGRKNLTNGMPEKSLLISLQISYTSGWPTATSLNVVHASVPYDVLRIYLILVLGFPGSRNIWKRSQIKFT